MHERRSYVNNDNVAYFKHNLGASVAMVKKATTTMTTKTTVDVIAIAYHIHTISVLYIQVNDVQ